MQQLLTTPEQPYLIQARAIHQCPKCAGPLKSVFRPPSTSSNWLMLMIGLFLTPFLIGIFILIAYNDKLKKEQQTTWWHCESCGYHVATQALGKPFPLVVRLVALSVLAIILIWAGITVMLARQETVKYEPNDPPSLNKKEGDGKQGKAGSGQVDPRRRRH
jgi:ribosomal protein L37AE/L43A